MIRIKLLLQLLPTFLLLAANGAGASLIGDQVTCHFSTSGDLVLDDFCSTSASTYQPVPAIVGGGTEFYAGLAAGSSLYIPGADIDIGTDFIQLRPRDILTGFYGSFLLDIGSLDWPDDPGAVISDVLTTAANLDLSALSVTYTGHSVHIAIENASLQADTVVNVQLFTVPVPTPLALTMFGLALLMMRTRITRRLASTANHGAQSCEIRF